MFDNEFSFFKEKEKKVKPKLKDNSIPTLNTENSVEIKNNTPAKSIEVETKEYIAEKFKNAKVGDECPICGSGSRIKSAAYGGGVYLDCNLKPDEHNRKATEEEKKAFFKSRKGKRQPGELGR